MKRSLILVGMLMAGCGSSDGLFATYDIAFGAVSAGKCTVSPQPLPGVQPGDICVVSVEGNLGREAGLVFTDCYVGEKDNIVLRVCSVENVTMNKGPFHVYIISP